MLSDETRQAIMDLYDRYPEGRQKSAVMPALYLAQADAGWLSPQALREVAELLRLPPVHVAAIATFYTMYETAPTGEHIIDVCTCLTCQICGGYDILAHLEKRLGIAAGQTTADGKITLREQECIGACTTAPALQVDYQFHEELTREAVDGMLDELLGQAESA